MKRQLLALFIIVLSLSFCLALASCGGQSDEGDNHEHTWDAGKITKEATEQENGIKTFTCTKCNKTKTEEVKYIDTDSKSTTVANEEEWKNLFILTNVTAEGVDDDGRRAGFVSDGECCIWMEGNRIDDYYFLKNGVWYDGGERDGLFYCYQETENEIFTLEDVSEFFEGFQDDYSEFSYNKAQKAYVRRVDEETVAYVYTAKVEDGELVNIKVSKINKETSKEGVLVEFSFKDYGTTVIESFPDFCTEHTYSKEFYESEYTSMQGFHGHKCETETCGNYLLVENGNCEVCNP